MRDGSTFTSASRNGLSGGNEKTMVGWNFHLTFAFDCERSPSDVENQNPHSVPPKNGGTRMGHPGRFFAGGNHVSGLCC